MRLAAIASALAIVLCVAVFGAIVLQKSSISGRSLVEAPADGRAVTGVPTVTAQASPRPLAPPWSAPSCSNPNALGVARVVEIDTTGGPGFGFEHFKSHD